MSLIFILTETAGLLRNRGLAALKEKCIEHADGLVDLGSDERASVTAEPENHLAQLNFRKYRDAMFFDNANDPAPQLLQFLKYPFPMGFPELI